MTPAEKAKELVNNFYCKKDELGLMFCINWSNAKQCALIAIDEVLNTIKSFDFGIKYLLIRGFLEEVKQEIEKL